MNASEQTMCFTDITLCNYSPYHPLSCTRRSASLFKFKLVQHISLCIFAIAVILTLCFFKPQA